MQVVVSKIRLMQRLSVRSVRFPSVCMCVCVSNCGLLIIAFMLKLELPLCAGRMWCVFVPEVIQQELSNPAASRDLWCLHVSLSAHNLFSSEELLTFCHFVCWKHDAQWEFSVLAGRCWADLWLMSCVCICVCIVTNNSYSRTLNHSKELCSISLWLLKQTMERRSQQRYSVFEAPAEVKVITWYFFSINSDFSL